MRFVEALVWNFHNKKKTSIGRAKYDCVIKTEEIFSFLPLILLNFLLLFISVIISTKTVNTLRFL